jgi:hypothetical protein
MRLTFLCTSLALCALCRALPLPSGDCQATTLHARGILHRPCEAWLPTADKSSFVRRLKVEFADNATDITREQREAIENELRGYHDDIRRRPSKTIPGSRLAVVSQSDSVHHCDHVTYDLKVKYYHQSLCLGYKWYSPTFAPDGHLVAST